MNSIENDLYDSALGCLLGACAGDAAGATLEFLGRKPTREEVVNAMSMPGGGFFSLESGQITDDGELTICLAQALSSSKAFSVESIANTYAEWVRSRPFDMGETTRNSLGCFLSFEWEARCQNEGNAAAMAKAAYSLCMESKANGSLMRASPLGIWGFRLEPRQLALYAKEDSRLSHPNRSCCDSVACYAIAISALMRSRENRSAAFQAARSWAESNANEEVCKWLDDAESNTQTPYHPQVGFIRIGFTHAFRHLLLGSSYSEAIEETLLGGGDTDTNACIVGGLIGAACGAESIPEHMKTPVLTCGTEKGQHTRPNFLRANRIPELVRGLLSNAPD